MITFFQVKDNTEKLKRICTIVQHHFGIKEAIIIAVASFEAANYIDKLLWRMPEESFLPHCICDMPTQELVVITTKQKNINRSKVLFNLCPEASPIAQEFTKIYELFDRTDLNKEQLSQKRESLYQSQGFQISKQ